MAELEGKSEAGNGSDELMAMLRRADEDLARQLEKRDAAEQDQDIATLGMELNTAANELRTVVGRFAAAMNNVDAVLNGFPSAMQEGDPGVTPPILALNEIASDARNAATEAVETLDV